MLTRVDVREIVNNLPFVRNLGIEMISIVDGVASVTMPYAEEFSTPPDLFPTAVVGAVGDVAAVGACFAAVPPGFACATLDYTVKNTGLAQGEALLAEGRALMVGKTISVGSADVYVIRGGEKHHCGSVLATARVYKVRSRGSAKE